MATFFTTDSWIKSLRRLKLDYGKKHRAVLQAQSINFLILMVIQIRRCYIKDKRGESRFEIRKYDLYDFSASFIDGNAIHTFIRWQPR